MRHRLIQELKDVLIVIGILLLIFLVVISGINLFVVAYASRSMTDTEAVTSVGGYNCVMVSDSGIWSKKTREVLLDDRLLAAYSVFRSGTADALLISGKSLESETDDTSGLYQKALTLGFPEESIIIDYESLTPIDAARWMLHESEIKSVIVVAQRIPLYRALYAARRTGLNVLGVKTLQPDIRYGLEVWGNFREFFKRAYDFIAIEVFRALD